MPQNRLRYIVQNTGEWKPIMDWLDEISGGQFRLPVFHRPPITRNPDGSLEVTNKSGVEHAEIGDYVYIGGEQPERELHVMPRAKYNRIRG